MGVLLTYRQGFILKINVLEMILNCDFGEPLLTLILLNILSMKFGDQYIDQFEDEDIWEMINDICTS